MLSSFHPLYIPLPSQFHPLFLLILLTSCPSSPLPIYQHSPPPPSPSPPSHSHPLSSLPLPPSFHKVCYTVTGWLDKNKDPLNDSVVDLLKKSTDQFVAGLWADYSLDAERTRGKKGSQFVTVGQVHKQSLHHLLTTLRKYSSGTP